MKRIVVLGAGFGGLEVATRLSAGLKDRADITVVDRSPRFHFGFSKLDILVGLARPDDVTYPYADIATPGVRFLQATIEAIDPAMRRVTTSAGTMDADILVVALGAVPDAARTRGLVDGGNEFYTFDGVVAARDALARFAGGRVIVAVTTPPLKCPPAPSEAALLIHDDLTSRGLRDASEIVLAAPFDAPIPPSPDGSAAVLAAFDERGIGWRPGGALTAVDAATHTASFSDGAVEPFDLLLAVPIHRVPTVVEQSGLCRDGWVAVDAETLRTPFENVYAIGDVAAAHSPKAGAFAVAQAGVVADQVIAECDGGHSSSVFDATGACLMEFGGGRVARVAMTGRRVGGGFTSRFDAPDARFADDKQTLTTSSIARWFAGS